MGTVTPIVTLQKEGYWRTFHAVADCVGETDVALRGVLEDPTCSIEHRWLVRTPGCEVLEAEARSIAGVSPALESRYRAIGGVRIGRGFSRVVREALGGLPGEREYLFLAIEMARVGQQVYRFPPGFDAGFAELEKSLPPGPGRDARISWEKDRAYMPDLADSCYTYRDGTRELFYNRSVTCIFGGELTSPAPGQKGVFERSKRLEIRADGGDGYRCGNRMQDNIHDIAIEFRLGRDGTVTGASSRAERMPYMGICEDAQLRTAGLNGRRIDGQFIRTLAEQVGGSTGCTHLFDLSVDCLRLFEF